MEGNGRKREEKRRKEGKKKKREEKREEREKGPICMIMPNSAYAQ